MQCLLALDQSTSATKAVLLDLQGEVLHFASREHRQLYPQPGWVEHDAEEIWRNTLGVLNQVLNEVALENLELANLSIANQRAKTIVVFERDTGRPIYPAIVWQCRRGDALCAEQGPPGT